MLQIHYHLPTRPTVMQLYIHSIKLVVTRGLTVDTHAMAVKLVSPQLGKSVGRAWRRRRRAGCLEDRCLVQAAPGPARGSARGAIDEPTVMMLLQTTTGAVLPATQRNVCTAPRHYPPMGLTLASIFRQLTHAN